VDDFKFDVLLASEVTETVFTRSAEIVFFIEGEAMLTSETATLYLTKRQSAFIPYNSGRYTVKG